MEKPINTLLLPEFQMPNIAFVLFYTLTQKTRAVHNDSKSYDPGTGISRENCKIAYRRDGM
jgi:hypothetical protein